jgi:hypothetical protein
MQRWGLLELAFKVPSNSGRAGVGRGCTFDVNVCWKTIAYGEGNDVHAPKHFPADDRYDRATPDEAGSGYLKIPPGQADQTDQTDQTIVE